MDEPDDHVRHAGLVERHVAVGVEEVEPVLGQQDDQADHAVVGHVDHVPLLRDGDALAFLHEVVPRLQLRDVDAEFLDQVDAVAEAGGMHVMRDGEDVLAAGPERITGLDHVLRIQQAVLAQAFGQVDEADVFKRAAGEVADGAFQNLDHVRDVASGLHGGLEAAHQDFLLHALKHDFAVIFLIELLDGLRIGLDMDFGLNGQNQIDPVLVFTQSHHAEHNTGDDCNDQDDKRGFSEWIYVSH